MNSSIDDVRAQKVWFDNDNMWILFTDGRQLAVPFAYFPRLKKATPEQRKNFEMSGGGPGLHWDELDEDISVPHLLLSSSMKIAV